MTKKITNKEILAQIRDLSQSVSSSSELQQIKNKEDSDWKVQHEENDNERFDKTPKLDEIKEVVGKAVDEKINGKLIGLKQDNSDIKEHLKTQDLTMKWLVWLATGILTGIGLVIVGVITNWITSGKL